MPRDLRDKRNALKRTYILSGLVLICVAYILNKRFLWARSDLASAKDKIAHIAQQPSANSSRAEAHGAAFLSPRALAHAEPAADAPTEASTRLAPPPGDPPRVARLTKGTFTEVDGEIVYGPDAELDLGNGMLVSSPSGVMVSDVDQRHFAGDLVIDSQYGTTTTENAFLSIDQSHVEITSDNTVTVKKDAPK
jgi:hypothetical protein